MNATMRRIAVGTLLIGALLSAERVYAAEQAKSVYLLGVTASMAGMTPPPGTSPPIKFPVRAFCPWFSPEGGIEVDDALSIAVDV